MPYIYNAISSLQKMITDAEMLRLIQEGQSSQDRTPPVRPPTAPEKPMNLPRNTAPAQWNEAPRPRSVEGNPDTLMPKTVMGVTGTTLQEISAFQELSFVSTNALDADVNETPSDAITQWPTALDLTLTQATPPAKASNVKAYHNDSYTEIISLDEPPSTADAPESEMLAGTIDLPTPLPWMPLNALGNLI